LVTSKSLRRYCMADESDGACPSARIGRSLAALPALSMSKNLSPRVSRAVSLAVFLRNYRVEVVRDLTGQGGASASGLSQL
jgi:hypothetical protein